MIKPTWCEPPNSIRIGNNEIHVWKSFLDMDDETMRRFPKYYAASDVFVLPSENETWGLAINEAMCAGLPIVASEEIGCVPDLVHNGVNGGTFVAKDVAGLANALRPILAEPDLRRRMGDASRDIVSRWSFTECRDGLRTALQSLGGVTMPTKVPKVVSQS